MPGIDRTSRDTKLDEDDTRLRYHLTSLYALKPIPDELLMMVRELAARLDCVGASRDND